MSDLSSVPIIDKLTMIYSKYCQGSLKLFLLVLLFFYIRVAFSYEIFGDNLKLQEVLPFFNVHEDKLVVGHEKCLINPGVIDIPEEVMLSIINEKIELKGFVGEVVYKDIVLRPESASYDADINIEPLNVDGINVDIKNVSYWYQAGFSTQQKQISGVLTYELLLSNDSQSVLNDKWMKSKQGGWIYVPQNIDLGMPVKVGLSPSKDTRLLIKVNISKNVKPGMYQTYIVISGGRQYDRSYIKIPLSIEVYPITLTDVDEKKYKKILFTAFTLGDNVGRSGSYTNSMRLNGDVELKKQQYRAYLQDIVDHGFNGVTIHDWEAGYLHQVLKISNDVGLKYVVLHATTPTSNQSKLRKHPIVNEETRMEYNKQNKELFYYGYDEVGGNNFLDNQLKLNQEIHRQNGLSVNAVFWGDMINVRREIGDDKSKCFDIIAHSMGSHGHVQMFRSLPFVPPSDICKSNGTQFLVYWHPNVEIPAVNRLFMGFWLWASGFDGVIPHGYYFPAHIDAMLANNAVNQYDMRGISPYNDWSFWLPGDPLRHHNAVYPSTQGPVRTLQWEAVLNGVMDLKYVLTLQEELENSNISNDKRIKINLLLSSIKQDVLKIESPYMNDRDAIVYTKKMESWKQSIRELLLN